MKSVLGKSYVPEASTTLSTAPSSAAELLAVIAYVEPGANGGRGGDGGGGSGGG